MYQNVVSLEQNAGLMKTLYLTLCAISFAFTTVGLEIDWHYVMLAVGGSFAGSLVLTYFRREKTLFEKLYKVFVAAVAGLIVGSVIVKYRGMVEQEYIAAVFAVCSCLALFFIRTAVGLAESNAGKITTTIIQRVFNIDLSESAAPAEKPSRSHRQKNRSPIMPPSVVPEDTVPPNPPQTVQVVETTIIKEKEGQL